MAEQVTNCLSESCVGCEHLHMHIGQYRCFKAKHAAEGEFICWPKVGTQYPPADSLPGALLRCKLGGLWTWRKCGKIWK